MPSSPPQQPHSPTINPAFRSFTFIDDCVEGVLRLMFSECDVPINLGTTEMVSMNEFMAIALSFEDKKLPIKHIEGPMGVRGRNSNNKLILEKLGWEPTIPICVGLKEVRPGHYLSSTQLPTI